MPTSTIMVTSFRIGLTAFQLNRGERASQSQCQPPRNSERRRFGWIICVIFQNILIRKDIIFSDEILLINKILNIHMSFFVDQQNFEQFPIIFLLINKILNNSLSFFYWSTKFWTVHYHFFIDQQNFEQLTIIFLLINKILNNSLSFFIDQQNFEIHQKSRFPTFSDNCEYLETKLIIKSPHFWSFERRWLEARRTRTDGCERSSLQKRNGRTRGLALVSFR